MSCLVSFEYEVELIFIMCRLSPIYLSSLSFQSSGSFQGPSSDGGAGESRGHSSTADPPTRPQLPSAPWTVSSSHAQK